MVKSILKLFLFFPLFAILFTGCENGLYDFFYTVDLDERLKEKDSFRFLGAGDRNPSFGDNYSFIVISDIHLDGGKTGGLEKLQDVITADPGIKFIVFLGDNTNNGKERDIETFLSVIGSLTVPCYPVLGNHDLFNNENWYRWKEKIGSTRYRIDADTATLFILDSANSYIGKKQMDWLENEIKNVKERVFVFTHQNLFATAPLYNIEDTMTINERARMASILQNKCDIMFMGHIHIRDDNAAGNVKYISVDCYRDTGNYCFVSVTPFGVTYIFKKLWPVLSCSLSGTDSIFNVLIKTGITITRLASSDTGRAI
jgi:predicted phosphodiesterase